jgi:hypothetical protein
MAKVAGDLTWPPVEQVIRAVVELAWAAGPHLPALAY